MLNSCFASVFLAEGTAKVIYKRDEHNNPYHKGQNIGKK